MLARKYADIKKTMDDNGILFSFSGYLSEAILFSLGDALRQKMAVADADVNTVKKVFSVFVEQTQNILRYSADKIGQIAGGEMSSGMVTIGTERGRFFIVCGNVMRPDHVEPLRQRLELLRGMDKDRIRAYYREQLREPPVDDSRGATIGLIEIARRASEPIQFGFEPTAGGRTFFCLKVCI